MRDVLTAADLDAILRGGGSAEDKLQRAARLGAERERERAAKVAETPFSGEQDDITMQAKDRIAEAIRRGEEGQCELGYRRKRSHGDEWSDYSRRWFLLKR